MKRQAVELSIKDLSRSVQVPFIWLEIRGCLPDLCAANAVPHMLAICHSQRQAATNSAPRVSSTVSEDSLSLKYM